MSPTPRRRFVLCICPADQRSVLAFLIRTASYEVLEAACVDDALRITDDHAQSIAAVLYCELTPYDGGVLAQVRGRLPNIPFIAFAENRQFIADGAVVIHSASQLIAYLAELPRLSATEGAA